MTRAVAAQVQVTLHNQPPVDRKTTYRTIFPSPLGQFLFLQNHDVELNEPQNVCHI